MIYINDLESNTSRRNKIRFEFRSYSEEISQMAFKTILLVDVTTKLCVYIFTYVIPKIFFSLKFCHIKFILQIFFVQFSSYIIFSSPNPNIFLFFSSSNQFVKVLNDYIFSLTNEIHLK